MATILEALQNAKFNIVDQPNSIGLVFGKEQLKNAVILLEKGYSLYDNIEELIDQHGSIENIPDEIE